MVRIRIGVLAVLSSLSIAIYADDEHSWGVHYLANAGVMVGHGDTKVLFDPFFRNGFGVYDLMPEEMEAELFAGTPPWDGIDAIFISHHHGDHFDPAVVMQFLERWPDVHLYAPRQAVDALLESHEGAGQPLPERLHGLELERDSAAVQIEMDGLQIEAVRIAHAGWPRRHADVENIVFRVTLDEDTTVMHLGDADSDKAHYVPHAAYWRQRSSDLALVPVWLMLSDKGRHVLEEYVDAEHEIGMHVYRSVPDDPEEREPKFEGLDIFTVPGETRRREQ